MTNKSVALGMKNVIWSWSMYINLPPFYVRNIVRKQTVVRKFMKQEL
jgi:hypothetical protein